MSIISIRNPILRRLAVIGAVLAIPFVFVAIVLQGAVLAAVETTRDFGTDFRDTVPKAWTGYYPADVLRRQLYRRALAVTFGNRVLAVTVLLLAMPLGLGVAICHAGKAFVAKFLVEHHGNVNGFASVWQGRY